MRLEAMAIWLEAIALRLEAIASRFLCSSCFFFLSVILNVTCFGPLFLPGSFCIFPRHDLKSLPEGWSLSS